MSFEWKDFLTLASFLEESQSTPCREAACRSAVSRAYFAAFCFARDYAQDKYSFRPSETGEDHSEVRRLFQARGQGKVAANLGRLLSWRTKCDYDGGGPQFLDSLA